MIDQNKLRKLDFEKLLKFYTIHKEGSIAKAAVVTGIPSYTFYYDLKILEEAFGTKLYLGGKKNFTLTEEGRRLADFCKQTLESLNMVIENEDSAHVNELTIHTMVTFAVHYFPLIIEEFKRKYPSIKINILSGPEYVNSKSNDFDIRVAGFADNREDLSQHLLRRFDYGYFASKDYIEKYDEPKKEEDIYNHNLLLYSGVHFLPDHIINNSKEVIETNSYPALFELCVRGFGICSLSLDIYHLLLKENKQKYSKLVRILPNVISEHDNVFFSFFRFTSKEKPIRDMLEISKNLIKYINISSEKNITDRKD